MNRKKKETGGRRSESGVWGKSPEEDESSPRLILVEEDEERGGTRAEYAPPDWRAMFVDALPLLEWIAAYGGAAGIVKQEHARRLIVRHYIAVTSRPGLAKTKMPAS